MMESYEFLIALQHFLCIITLPVVTIFMCAWLIEEYSDEAIACGLSAIFYAIYISVIFFSEYFDAPGDVALFAMVAGDITFVVMTAMLGFTHLITFITWLIIKYLRYARHHEAYSMV